MNKFVGKAQRSEWLEPTGSAKQTVADHFEIRGWRSHVKNALVAAYNFRLLPMQFVDFAVRHCGLRSR